MYCPSCRGEFREGFVHCDACRVDLVEALPVPAESAPDDLAPALYTSDELLVSAARSALENEGIPCVIQGEEARGLLAVNAVLLVPRDRLDEARALIEILETGPPEGDSSEAP